MINSIPIGKKFPEVVNTIIEIQKDTRNKYEFDEELNIIKLDRVLHSPMFYPMDYGFIPETRADDGDHLDMMVMTNSPVFAGCMLEVRPIGVLFMSDESGQDEKILGVPLRNPNYNHIQTIDDISPHFLKEIVHFFETYKQLENKEVNVDRWGTKEEAYAMIKKYFDVYQKEVSEK